MQGAGNRGRGQRLSWDANGIAGASQPRAQIRQTRANPAFLLVGHPSHLSFFRVQNRNTPVRAAFLHSKHPDRPGHTVDLYAPPTLERNVILNSASLLHP